MNEHLRTVLIWILPLVLLFASGYIFLKAATILVVSTDNMQRLDGYAYAFSGIVHIVILIIISAISTALTLYFKRKNHISNEK